FNAVGRCGSICPRENCRIGRFGFLHGKTMNTQRQKFILMRLAAVLGFALFACIWLVPDFSAQQQLSKDEVPLGLPADTWDYYIPKNNPLTASKIELGRKLFLDARLSADGKVSCSSCHKPELAFTDGKTVAEGIEGKTGVRNSPTLLNAMFYPGQFWDGRASDSAAHDPGREG